MVLHRQEGNPLDRLTPVMTRGQLAELQKEVAATYIGEAVVSYIVSLIAATRNHEDLQRGASPRATLSVTAMAKAIARLRGRDYVIPADVREVFVNTVAHRLLLSPAAEARDLTAEDVAKKILGAVKAPVLR